MAGIWVVETSHLSFIITYNAENVNESANTPAVEKLGMIEKFALIFAKNFRLCIAYFEHLCYNESNVAEWWCHKVAYRKERKL